MNRAPLNLIPRGAVDASSQRIGALMFRGLTRIDHDLRVQPDLAESWTVSQGGKRWSFKLRKSLVDHARQKITASKMARCLEEYRIGKPVSRLKSAFPNWIATQAQGEVVHVTLAKPDAYFDRNASLLRYFTHSGSKVPCSEPGPTDQVIASGSYRMVPWSSTPKKKLDLMLADPTDSSLAEGLRFVFVQDDTTQALHLLRGQIDLIQNELSLAKTRWIQREFKDRFRILERDGVNVSYLAFNLEDPDLRKVKVRRAIAHAIDREAIVRNKFFGFGSVAGSFLSPLLPESYQVRIPFDLKTAERLLDEAGYPKGPDGIRLHLTYKTTPVREGLETGLIFQNMLKKVGIELELQVVEPAVFFATVTKGAYQLHSARWIGVSDGSIFYRSLHSSQRTNRARYKSREMDRILERAMSEPDSAKRLVLLKKVQKKMAEDLPYFPLWYWNNAVIIRRELASQLSPEALSLSGAYDPLAVVRKATRDK